MAKKREYTVQFRSDVTVEAVSISASDSMVAAAARVSTASSWDQATSEQGREGLINYLMSARHGSPFEHNQFCFRVEAPIFVWREHMRHRMMSYNEASGRYKELAPEFYVPGKERNLVQVGKPGQYVYVPGTQEQQTMVFTNIVGASTRAYASYQTLLDMGVAREVARMLLPVNIYSQAVVTCNARSLMHFLSLRTISQDSTFPSFPMREIEMVAEQYEDIFAAHMPLTHDAFCANGRVAP